MANEVKITGSARVAGGQTKNGLFKVQCAADDGLITGTIYMADAPPKGSTMTFTIK